MYFLKCEKEAHALSGLGAGLQLPVHQQLCCAPIQLEFRPTPQHYFSTRFLSGPGTWGYIILLSQSFSLSGTLPLYQCHVMTTLVTCHCHCHQPHGGVFFFGFSRMPSRTSSTITVNLCSCTPLWGGRRFQFVPGIPRCRPLPADTLGARCQAFPKGKQMVTRGYMHRVEKRGEKEKKLHAKEKPHSANGGPS